MRAVLATPNDTSRVNEASFNTNVIIGDGLFVAAQIDLQRAFS